MGLLMGQKCIKSGATGLHFCGTYISETAWWIYTVRSFMEFPVPVVVQHHGFMTLALYFQVNYWQNVSLEYEGWLTQNQKDANRQEVGHALWLWPLPRPSPWDLNGKYLKRNGVLINMGRKWCKSTGNGPHLVALHTDLSRGVDLELLKVKFWKKLHVRNGRVD